MCALTLSDKSMPCKLSKSKSESVQWMFYDDNNYPVVTNNKVIPVRYTLDKDDGVSILKFYSVFIKLILSFIVNCRTTI